MKFPLLAAAASIVFLAPAVAGGAQPVASLARNGQSCGEYAVRARVGNTAMCLRDEQRCRAKFERQYQRYGFHCHSGSLAATWKRLNRPLHFPRLDAGATCPISAIASGIDFRAHGVGPGIGPGPVFPAPFSPDATQPLNDFTVPLGWHGGKHALFKLPRYRGPVLIRGGQADGSGVVTFASNEIRGAPSLADPKPELRLAVGTRSVVHTFFFLTPPGCYAYQIDGTTFSDVVIFRVTLSD
jgi:hypothetical protein